MKVSSILVPLKTLCVKGRLQSLAKQAWSRTRSFGETENDFGTLGSSLMENVFLSILKEVGWRYQLVT